MDGREKGKERKRKRTIEKKKKDVHHDVYAFE